MTATKNDRHMVTFRDKHGRYLWSAVLLSKSSAERYANTARRPRGAYTEVRKERL